MNRKFITGLAVIAVACLATSLGAQDPNYIMTMSSGSTVAGGSLTLEALLDNNGGNVAGWSYGVCSPAGISASSVALADTATVNGGAAPGFQSTTVVGTGFTQGVVINLFGANPLPTGTAGFGMAAATYAVDGGAAPGFYQLDFCSTLGTPPVATVVVVSGASIPPTTVSGQVEVIDCPGASFDYVAPNAGPFNYPADAGAGSVAFSASFSIAETTGSLPGCPGPGAATQGFSMGVSHDGVVLLATSAAVTGAVAAINGGTGPDFETANLFANGWTIGVVYSFAGAATVSFSPGAPAVAAGYSGVAGALLGVAGASSTALTWDSGLGSPPVANVVVVGGGSIGAGLVDGSVTLNGTTTLPFVAADCNGDGITNIADIIWLLSQLFLSGPNRNCDIACDANGDGNLDAADAVYTASYIFLGGPPPAGPAGCATLPSQTPEDCEQDNCS